MDKMVFARNYRIITMRDNAYQDSTEQGPAVKRSEVTIGMVLASEGFKFISLEKSHYLAQYCVTMGHDSDLLVFVCVLAK